MRELKHQAKATKDRMVKKMTSKARKILEGRKNNMHACMHTLHASDEKRKRLHD